MSIRVHELAKELNLNSKELVEKLKALHIDAKSHMSVITDEQLATFKSAQSSKNQKAKTKEAPAAAKEVKPAVVVSATTVVPPAPKTVEPAVATAPVTAKKSDSGASSIENAKKELMQRREEVKQVQAAAPVQPKKVNTVSSATQTTSSRPQTESYKAKVVHTEIKKPQPVAKPVYEAKPVVPPTPAKPKIVELDELVIVKDLADKFSLKAGDLITRLIKIGIFASINQSVPFEVAKRLGAELGFEIIKPSKEEVENKDVKVEVAVDKAKLVTRAPVVTFMGHVDHGKTSLLDAIRKTKVAAGEAGGITQHIGAYEVFLPKGAVTFLDTPGHEAFTAMRARGAQATDVVVIVVAADDGVMPQTIEAIDHAKAAGVAIIVAINKIDLPAANIDKVKKELMEHGLMTEEWGGKTVMIGVSAKTGKGIDDLLEMLILESELLELKANPSATASGVVIEAEMSKGSGVLATVLVQDGTLRVGDVVVVGNYHCKVRAMINDRGVRIKEALPSMPVEILGLPGVPNAGDKFFVAKDEHEAKDILDSRNNEKQDKMGASLSHVTLEHLYEDVKAGKVTELKLIIKSDVQGSVEALRATLDKIQSKNVRLAIIHTGIGDISESDVMLAAASNAVIIGFHVGIVGSANEIADREQVDIRYYSIIYEAKTAIEKAMEGLLEPEKKEVFLGSAEVRQVFKVSKKGTIAGCMVIKGKIVRNSFCRVMRNGKKVHEGKIESLKRFKDDAREVLEGFDCGIGVSNFDEILSSDRIEAFEIQEKARKLE